MKSFEGIKDMTKNNFNSYILKSSIQEIADSFTKQNYGCGQVSLDAAEYLIMHCPKELYINIDEMVNNLPISDISIYLPINGKEKKIIVNQVKKDFYNLPTICNILLAIAKNNNGEDGFGWLAGICK